jgi:hypothetical protein
MTGRVESAVRAAVRPGEILWTPSGRGRFSIAEYTSDGLVLLLGEKQAWTPLPWRALEEVPDLLRGRRRVLIGSLYSTDSLPGSLDEHLKGFFPEPLLAGWRWCLSKPECSRLTALAPRRCSFVRDGELLPR